MNNVPTLPCFSMLSPTKPHTDLRQADGLMHRSVDVISGRHLLSTQKSSSRRSFSPRGSGDGAFSRLRPCTVSLCFFSTIMILSSVHKHTSPKCFPSRAWNRFHLCLICFLLSFTLFFLLNYGVENVCSKHIKTQLNQFKTAENNPEI